MENSGINTMEMIGNTRPIIWDNLFFLLNKFIDKIR